MWRKWVTSRRDAKDTGSSSHPGEPANIAQTTDPCESSTTSSAAICQSPSLASNIETHHESPKKESVTVTDSVNHAPEKSSLPDQTVSPSPSRGSQGQWSQNLSSSSSPNTAGNQIETSGASQARPSNVIDRVQATPLMCAYAFAVLEQHLHVSSPTSNPKTLEKALPMDTKEYGVFVTWKKRDRHEKVWHLRGCIGTLTPTPLHDALQSYALTSALHDRRFSPVSSSELQMLECSVSLLSDFQQKSSIWDWVPGTHGLILELSVRDTDLYGNSPAWRHPTTLSATYLPEIALELGWTHYETICSLIRKSGYTGSLPQTPDDSWWSQHVSLTTYTSSKAHMTFDEYRAWLVQSLN